MKKILFAFCLSWFFSGCGKEGCMNPIAQNFDVSATKNCSDCCDYGSEENSTNLTISLFHQIGDIPLDTNFTYTIGGRSVQILSSRFYIASIKSKINPSIDFEQYHFVNNETTSLNIGEISNGNYQGICLDIGVKETDNHNVPNSFQDGHALAPKIPDMFWSVSDGHIFFELIGKVDTSSTPDGIVDETFVFEFGLDANFANICIDKNIEIPDSFNGNLNLNLVVDYAEILNSISYSEYTKVNRNFPNNITQIKSGIESAFKLK